MGFVDQNGVLSVREPASAPAVDVAVVAQAETPSLLDYPATYLLIAVNVAVYLLMFRFGPLPSLFRTYLGTGTGLHGTRIWVPLITEAFTAPFSQRVLTSFGSCIPLRVLAFGEWWRLFTSIFVHVTLLHLLLNMWCLWNLGLFGEPLLGRPGLIAVYLLTGVAGMLQAVIWSLFSGEQFLVIAGASGAVFGLAGILIVMLSNRKLAAPWEELRSLRLQVVFFALANLLVGMLPNLVARLSPGLRRWMPFDLAQLPRVDNSAHLGGFLLGLLLGMLLFPRMASGKSSYRARQAMVFGTAGLVLILVGYAVATFTHALAGAAGPRGL